MTYSEKLKDPRWQRLRLKILEAANWRCQDCEDKRSPLEVHHTAYLTGRQPWEYNSDLLMCLCANCHERRQGFEDAFRLSLGKICSCLPIAQLEDEVWRILKDVSERETSRLASSFNPGEE